MATHSPMTVLRELAEQSLDEATSTLGKMRQAHASANQQHDQLVGYQQEYCNQLQTSVAGKGMSVISLLNQNAFIESLGKAIEQQHHYVSECQQSVDLALLTWRQDKKRFNAFTTLKNRADSVAALKASRQDQKLMDEFAQRASSGRGNK
ncbi:flagellar export protein FliJ [Erwinia typographi]|nr:flagellar export protein FliJ [Erwinia typographi]